MSQIRGMANKTLCVLSNRCTRGKSEKHFIFHKTSLDIAGAITFITNIKELHHCKYFPYNNSNLKNTATRQGLLIML